MHTTSVRYCAIPCRYNIVDVGDHTLYSSPRPAVSHNEIRRRWLALLCKRGTRGSSILAEKLLVGGRLLVAFAHVVASAAISGGYVVYVCECCVKTCVCNGRGPRPSTVSLGLASLGSESANVVLAVAPADDAVGV